MGEDTALNPRHNKAEVFARLRDAHAREVTEDYVEMIGDLIAEEGEARSVALAERFGVTAATVNNTIKRLEDVLGVRLFHRNAGRLTPTRTARQIFEIVQPSMTGLEQLSSTVFEIASGQSVTLRMGVSPSVSQALGPKALARLARRNPGAKLRMDTLSLTQIKDYLWLAEGDCVVTIYPVNDAMIVSQKIAEISMACIVPREHPMADNDSVYIDQLADERLIFFHPNTPHGRWVKDIVLRRADYLLSLTPPHP